VTSRPRPPPGEPGALAVDTDRLLAVSAAISRSRQRLARHAAPASPAGGTDATDATGTVDPALATALADLDAAWLSAAERVDALLRGLAAHLQGVAEAHRDHERTLAARVAADPRYSP